MASQASQRDVQGQRTTGAAGPSSTNVGHFKNVTRHNGVSFKATENVPIQSYINAFTTTVPANDVISASRISNGRIAVYLSTKEAVINAVQRGLEYQGTLLELTPLIRPTTRLILSNVYPEIPNSVLVENLSSFCKVVSDCKPIPLGFKDKKLNHIMSFRRHVQVLMKPNVTPPDHINFTFSGVNYRVFLSTESVRCFNCGEFGHISRACKKPKTGENAQQAKQPTQNAPVSGTSSSGARQHGPSPPRAAAPAASLPSSSTGTRPHPHTPPRPSVSLSGSPAHEPPPPSLGETSRSTPSGPTPSTPLPQPPSSMNTSSTSVTPTIVSSHTPSRFPPQKSAVYPSPVWKTPPVPVRTFSDVVAKRKQLTPTPAAVNIPTLTTLKAPSPIRKVPRRASPAQTESPTLTQALDSQTPDIPSTPTSSVGDPSDTDSMTWEDAQTDEDLPSEAVLPLTQGPLSQGEIIKFLSNVKGRKKPAQIARKYTSNIPGLVKQLKPLKNSPLVKRNMQQRIYKLISTLDN